MPQTRPSSVSWQCGPSPGSTIPPSSGTRRIRSGTGPAAVTIGSQEPSSRAWACDRDPDLMHVASEDSHPVEEDATSAGLRYVSTDDPGIARHRRGTSFEY